MNGDLPMHLIGFDVRVAGVWSAERRATYLLRPEVDAPLSVDRAVWPSAIPDDGQWRGANDGLFDDLGRARAFRDQLAGDDRTLVAIAVASASPEPFHVIGVNPKEALPHWSPLGFDVADRWLTSGLSNCGYSDAERASHVPTWRASLNGAHLFTEYATARRFADVTDERVREHAPFFVFHLWRVD